MLCCCHVVVALLSKLPCPLCGDLTTLILLEFLDRKHSNITFPDRVCGFCCCVVVGLLLRCCCVVVGAPPPVCKDLIALLLLNSRKQVLLPGRFPTVFMGFVVAFVVEMLMTLLRCCWRSPTGVRGFNDIFVIKLKKTSTSSGTLPHRVYGICCEICC